MSRPCVKNEWHLVCVLVASSRTFSLLAERISSTMVRSASGTWSEAYCRALPMNISLRLGPRDPVTGRATRVDQM